MDEILNLINTVGFPIAMVVYFIYDKNKSTKDMFDNVTNCINQMSTMVSECINNNSKIMSTFVEHFDIENLVKTE